MPDSFRDLRKFTGPPWLVGEGQSILVGYCVDLAKDAFAERCRQALLTRFPQQTQDGQNTAPADALAALGRDRRIVQGIDETNEAYAARLVLWLDTWKTAGNPYALMGQLKAYLGPLASLRTVDVRGNWYSLSADVVPSVLLNQANWDWDGSPSALSNWSRFWVVVYPNGLWQGPGPTTYADGHKWGDGRTWGSTATTEEVASLQGIVRDWKPAGTTCVNIIIAFDPASFSPTQVRDGAGLPDGTWGKWGYDVAGTFSPHRLATAVYLDGA